MTNFTSLDLNLLRVLDALLSEGSTVRAGARLGLSQPAVSAALSRLRAALGDELFFRRGQGLEPTHFARSLEAPLREALDGLQTLLSGPASFDPAASDISFTVSGSDFFAELLMPELAGRLARSAPGMRVHLVDLVPDSFVGTLQRLEVDLALVPEVEAPDWVESRRLFASSFVVAARKGHPRLQRAGIAPGDTLPLDLFCELSHVVFSPEGKARTMGDAALERVGRARRVVMTMPVFSGVYRAVAGSELIALLPHQLARQVAPAAGLDLYRVPIPVDPVEIVMIWHRRFSASPAHVWMRDEIADVLARLDAPAPEHVEAP